MLDSHSPVPYTLGGYPGHWLRRSIHLSTALIPFVYYFFLQHWLYPYGLLFLLAMIILFEGLRLYRGWLFLGQRTYETHYISAFAWGIASLLLVLLLAPDERYAFPIILSYALGDPLLGELRRYTGTRQRQNIKIHFIVACLSASIITAIWLICSLLLATPWWLALLMGPLTVAVEWPSIKWIDDNALMQLVPLTLILVLVKMSLIA